MGKNAPSIGSDARLSARKDSVSTLALARAQRSRQVSRRLPYYLAPAMLLRYVLSNPNISVAIPGARYPSRIRENVELALNYQPLNASQKQRYEEEAKLLF